MSVHRGPFSNFPHFFSFSFPHAQATRARGVMSMAQSKALPFLKAPAKLDGSLAGDFGFDPMGISDQVGKMEGAREGRTGGKEGLAGAAFLSRALLQTALFG